MLMLWIVQSLLRMRGSPYVGTSAVPEKLASFCSRFLFVCSTQSAQATPATLRAETLSSYSLEAGAQGMELQSSLRPQIRCAIELRLLSNIYVAEHGCWFKRRMRA